MAYILAPIFIFAVGFASWTIITPSISFFSNGSFIANGLMDSTKYISLTNPGSTFTTSYMVGGFVGENGAVMDTTKFTIQFNIELDECNAIYNGEDSEASSNKVLYFSFSLCFADRTESDVLFQVENFEPKVTLEGFTGKASENDQHTSTFSNTATKLTDTNGVVATLSTKEEITSSSYVFVLALDFNNLDTINTFPDTTALLTVEYMLTPQSATVYRELMDIIMAGGKTSKGLMIDVRITDYAPY